MRNIGKLTSELLRAKLPVESVTVDAITYSRALTAPEQTAADAVIAAHDPTDTAAQYAAGAATELAASPLAKMNYTQAAAWIDATVTDLASARTALKALARMVVALRDAQFPHLRDRY